MQAFINNDSNDNDDDKDYPHPNQVCKRRDFWDVRFELEVAYEWLASYTDLKSILDERLRKTDAILIVGCGNSQLGPDLAEDGFVNIVSCDFSSTVITNQRQRYPSQNTWVVSNVRNLKEFSDEQFDIVIDKATMDALVTDEGSYQFPNKRTIQDCNDMCSSISRVLKPGGKLVQITCQLREHRRKYLFHQNNNWEEKECIGINAMNIHSSVFVIQKKR